eukprot:scaffold18653_cov136-Amphora_coffeaeformis.AAC.2
MERDRAANHSMIRIFRYSESHNFFRLDRSEKEMCFGISEDTKRGRSTALDRTEYRILHNSGNS